MQRATWLPFVEQGPEAPHFDFAPLVAEYGTLQPFARRASSGALSLDLSTQAAKLALTRAILFHHFDIRLILPPGQLIPTIPNRVQYLSWASSLLGSSAVDLPCTVLDIGTGPSCIYPLLGARLFPNWRFTATDIDKNAVQLAKRNIAVNSISVVTVHQTTVAGRMLSEEVMASKPDLTVCNPPFHTQLPSTKTLSGTESQLVTQGGELEFIRRLADESTQSHGVAWFTSLVGRKADLPAIVRHLRSDDVSALHIKTVELSQGGRMTRWAVAWSFGEETSMVKLIRGQGSKWRQIYSVRPGRAFANQLRSEDLAACFSTVLQRKGWVASEESHRLEHPGELFHGGLRTIFERTKLEVNVINGPLAGEYHTHVKVADRGEMKSTDFDELGEAVIEDVSNLLKP